MLLCLLCGSGGEYKEELILNVTVFVVRVWGRGISRGTDTEYYCVCCECLGIAIKRGTDSNVTVFVVRVWGRAIYRGTDTECYCGCCECLGEGNIERN